MTLTPDITSLSWDTAANGIYWGAEWIESDNVFGGVTAINLQNFDALKVTDGDSNAVCFDWNLPGESAVVWDLGTPLAIRRIRYATTSNSFPSGNPIVETSDDDGLTWQQPVTSVSCKKTVGGITFWTTTVASTAGAHRRWRLKKLGTGAENIAFTEISMHYLVAPHSGVIANCVYNVTGGVRTLHARVPVGSRPTASRLLDVEDIQLSAPSTIFQQGSTSLHVVVTSIYLVNSTEVESDGFEVSNFYSASEVTTSNYVPQLETDIELSSGLNSDVWLPYGGGVVVITATGGAPASIDGFDATNHGEAEQYIIHNDSGQTLTIVPASSSVSASANRIENMSASVAIATGGMFRMFRSARTNRWRFEFGRDAAGLK